MTTPDGDPPPRASAQPRRLRLTVQRASRSTLQPSSARLRRWATSALATPARITLRLVDRPEAQRLNRSYRSKDYPTNVLTFVYDSQAGYLQGDLVLCAPVIKAEARAQHKPLPAHWAHLVVHGVLHLQGHDHQRPAQARLMESREAAILAELGIPDPYLAP